MPTDAGRRRDIVSLSFPHRYEVAGRVFEIQGVANEDLTSGKSHAENGRCPVAETLEEMLSHAAAIAFLAHEKGGGSPAPLPASGLTLTKFAAEYVERRSPSWKPSTVKATLSYLNCAILPALGNLRVDSVVCADVDRFFHDYGSRKSGSANRNHEIEIMRYYATCSTVLSCGASGPKPPGTRAGASSAAGDRRAGGCSARSYASAKLKACSASQRCAYSCRRDAGRGRYAACAGERSSPTT